MKPPRCLLVGPHRYRVIVDRAGLIGDNGQCGHTSIQRGVIAIDGEQTPSQVADTLCHELFGHALLAAAGLSDEDEERVCLLLGPGVLRVLWDNPDLYPYLISSKETNG